MLNIRKTIVLFIYIVYIELSTLRTLLYQILSVM